MVPVGTVIHLVQGEIPSTSIENKSSGVLDPWDIPGTLSFGSPESSHQSTTRGRKDMEKTDNANEDSALLSKENSKGTASLQCSPSRDKSRNQTESDFCPKPHGYSDWEDMDGEVSMSGSECGEDSEEIKDIQYNVAELTDPGQRITIARGGDGGMGNLHLGKGSKTHKDADSKRSQDKLLII